MLACKRARAQHKAEEVVPVRTSTITITSSSSNNNSMRMRMKEEGKKENSKGTKLKVQGSRQQV